MKIKMSSNDDVVLGFTKREIMILSNCINEACHGLIMDRFIPVHDELIEMMDCLQSTHNPKELFNLKPIRA